MVALDAVLLTVVIAAAQTPEPTVKPVSPPSGLVLGRVVDAGTGRPIPGAVVSIDGTGAPSGTGGPQPRAMTNASGNFVFRKVPQGSFALTATRSGYVDGGYGRRRPGGSLGVLQLESGERVGDITIRMWRHGVIAGTVSDEAGEPLVSVQVRAFHRRYVAGRRRIAQAATATTDDRGAYRFPNLAPGEYLVAFVSREISMPASTAELLRSPAGSDPKAQELQRERMTLGSVPLPPGSPGTMQIGQMIRQVDMNAPTPPPASENGPLFIYPTQFFPGVSNVTRAAAIQIGSGQQRDGIDFSLRPVRSARVSGMVMGPDGPAANIALRLVPAGEEFATDLETSNTMAGPDGEFTFLGVPAGQYVIKVMRVPRPATPPPGVTTQIQLGSSMMVTTSGPAGGARAPIPDDPTIFAEQPVAVADSDLTGVVVPLQRGARITGRLEFDGTRERPEPSALSRIAIVPERADAGSQGPFTLSIPSGGADESGAFKTYGIPPGRYFVRVPGAPPGWTLKSVISEGRDLSDTPLDLRGADVANVVITFTDRPTKLTGIARTSAGTPDPEAMVVVFPADTAAWTDFGMNPRRMRSARPGKGGSYTFTGLPAGEYYVAALREDTVAQWQDPAVLEELSRSAPTVRLADGESRVQDVKSAGGVR